jgi:hypothetical protein
MRGNPQGGANTTQPLVLVCPQKEVLDASAIQT